MWYEKIYYIVFLLSISLNCYAQEVITKTNMDSLNIYIHSSEESENYICFQHDSKEKVDKDYIGLFINGSIIKDANVYIKDNRIFVPLRIILENFDMNVEWEEASGKISISNQDNRVELYINNKNAKVNDKDYILDTEAEIYNNTTYVPLRFITEAFDIKADYFDGKDETKTHMVLNLPHVMISKYPSDIKPLSQDEAIELLKEKLIIAYERKFGEFLPSEYNQLPTKNGDKEIIKYFITNLKVASENDRYYVIPFLYDFWIDKYTGDIYTYYNGYVMSVSIFNPYDENALIFAG